MHRGLMPWKEVARRVGGSEEEVRKTGHAALLKLREYLEDQDISVEEFRNLLHLQERLRHDKDEGLRRLYGSGPLATYE